MWTELVVDAILNHLPARDVNSLRLCNSSFKEFIDRNRLKYAATEVQVLHLSISSSCQNGLHVYCPKYKHKIMFGVNQVMADAYNLQFLIHHLSPKRVFLDDNVAKLIDLRWLKRAEGLTINGISDENSFLELLGKMKFSNVSIEDPMVDVDIDKVLDTMPDVSILETKVLEYGKKLPAKCSSTTLQTLISKSHLGEGLKKVCIFNKKETPFDPDQVISFLKTAKFQPVHAKILLAHVAGNKKDFTYKMEALMNETGWNVTCHPYPKYVIETPETMVKLLLESSLFSMY